MAKRSSHSEQTNDDAPDPSNTYERAHPEREAGMGRLDNDIATPTNQPDVPGQAVKNKQQPSRGISGQDNVNRRASSEPAHAPRQQQRQQQTQPDHSMHEEEPLGWDQAPTDIKDPRHKRHPRKEGRGGLK
jgi:hypothetical protein